MRVHASQAGFGLIEVMIMGAITVALSMAIMTVVSNANHAQAGVTNLAELDATISLSAIVIYKQTACTSILKGQTFDSNSQDDYKIKGLELKLPGAGESLVKRGMRLARSTVTEVGVTELKQVGTDEQGNHIYKGKFFIEQTRDDSVGGPLIGVRKLPIFFTTKTDGNGFEEVIDCLKGDGSSGDGDDGDDGETPPPKDIEYVLDAGGGTECLHNIDLSKHCKGRMGCQVRFLLHRMNAKNNDEVRTYTEYLTFEQDDLSQNNASGLTGVRESGGGSNVGFTVANGSRTVLMRPDNFAFIQNWASRDCEDENGQKGEDGAPYNDPFVVTLRAVPPWKVVFHVHAL